MARRARRRSFGSVTEMVRGKKYVIRWVQNTPEGRKRKSKTIHGTYREACRELALREVEHGDEQRMPTWGEVYELWYRPWLDRRLESGRISEATHAAYTRAWETRISALMASKAVDGLSPLELQRWLLTITKSRAKVSMPVIAKMSQMAASYTGCNALFGNGQRYEMPTAVKERSKRVLTLSEAMDMLGRLEGSPVEARFILACFGGLRTGEALAVRSDDVEAVGRFAAVDVSKQMPGHGCEPVQHLKNEQSVRVAVVPPPFSKRLLELSAESESGWLSDRGDGLPEDKGRSLWTWRHELKRIGEEPFPFANLRNSWRTIAQAEKRVPWELAEVLMGHKLPGVSGSHYIRQSREQVVEWACECLGTWDMVVRYRNVFKHGKSPRPKAGAARLPTRFQAP